MVTKKRSKKKSSQKTGWQAVRPRMDFRFKSHDHHNAVKLAAELEGRSVNDWMVIVTLRAAEEALENAKT